MVRRFTGHMDGQQYLGNKSKLEVHDLDHETEECHIDEIIKHENDKPFDNLGQADELAYDHCSHCLPESER